MGHSKFTVRSEATFGHLVPWENPRIFRGTSEGRTFLVPEDWEDRLLWLLSDAGVGEKKYSKNYY